MWEMIIVFGEPAGEWTWTPTMHAHDNMEIDTYQTQIESWAMQPSEWIHSLESNLKKRVWSGAPVVFGVCVSVAIPPLAEVSLTDPACAISDSAASCTRVKCASLIRKEPPPTPSERKQLQFPGATCYQPE
jgi:hypothetical protein